MIPVENAGVTPPNARIDLYRITVGANKEENKFEVLGVYLHTLASFLPANVIKTILKDEFEPEEMRLLLSRRIAAEAERLNSLFLKRAQTASLSPLRSEQYGASPRHVTWHYFAVQSADSLMEILRKLDAKEA